MHGCEVNINHCIIRFSSFYANGKFHRSNSTTTLCSLICFLTQEGDVSYSIFPTLILLRKIMTQSYTIKALALLDQPKCYSQTALVSDLVSTIAPSRDTALPKSMLFQHTLTLKP